MEDKRYAFPRFYFISDDELLKILSTATDIHDTEKNLSKVFEFINKLDYSPSNAITAVAMVSFEGERVGYKKNVTWKKDAKVEENMMALEESMVDAIKSRFKHVLDDYSKSDDIEKFKLQWI